MPKSLHLLIMSLVFVIGIAGPSQAQSSNPGWKTTIYPVFGWVPTGNEINVNLPSIGGGGGGGGDVSIDADIVDGRFDGAYFGGFSTTNGVWRVDATGLWAAVGGDRSQTPVFTVDVDLIYFHATGGRQIAGDLFATGGVRRLALKYDILLANQYRFERKPGVWDPVVGLGWHTVRDKYEFHAAFETGGFGVGTDLEIAGNARIDWKPFTHFGLTAGYQLLYFKVEDDVVNRPLTVKQTLQGPTVGIGLYF